MKVKNQKNLEKIRRSISINAKVLRALKVVAVERDTTMQELIESAIIKQYNLTIS